MSERILPRAASWVIDGLQALGHDVVAHPGRPYGLWQAECPYCSIDIPGRLLRIRATDDGSCGILCRTGCHPAAIVVRIADGHRLLSEDRRTA